MKKLIFGTLSVLLTLSVASAQHFTPRNIQGHNCDVMLKAGVEKMIASEQYGGKWNLPDFLSKSLQKITKSVQSVVQKLNRNVVPASYTDDLSQQTIIKALYASKNYGGEKAVDDIEKWIKTYESFPNDIVMAAEFALTASYQRAYLEDGSTMMLENMHPATVAEFKTKRLIGGQVIGDAISGITNEGEKAKIQRLKKVEKQLWDNFIERSNEQVRLNARLLKFVEMANEAVGPNATNPITKIQFSDNRAAVIKRIQKIQEMRKKAMDLAVVSGTPTDEEIKRVSPYLPFARAEGRVNGYKDLQAELVSLIRSHQAQEANPEYTAGLTAEQIDLYNLKRNSVFDRLYHNLSGKEKIAGAAGAVASTAAYIYQDELAEYAGDFFATGFDKCVIEQSTSQFYACMAEGLSTKFANNGPLQTVLKFIGTVPSLLSIQSVPELVLLVLDQYSGEAQMGLDAVAAYVREMFRYKKARVDKLGLAGYTIDENVIDTEGISSTYNAIDSIDQVEYVLSQQQVEFNRRVAADRKEEVLKNN